jgi:long-chain acyl-CoA synthetase
MFGMNDNENPHQLTIHNEPQSLRELLETRVESTPDKDFLFSESDRRSFTFREFDETVNRTANMLLSHGVGKGDTVSLLMPNSVEYIVAYFACFKIGALAGPVNSLLKAQEMAYVIGNSEAKAILMGSEFFEAVQEFRHDLPALRAIIQFHDVCGAADRFSSSNERFRNIEITSEDEAIIIYTSGTTGKPKGCLLTHGNLISNARHIATWLGFGEEDRLLSMMPLFHMNAVSVTTMSALYAGGSTVVSPKFSASRFWQIISDHEITSFGSVATMLSMLLTTYPDGVPRGLKTDQLRFAMCGSAPVPAEILKRFEETFNCLVVEGYGLSESTCRSTFNPPNEKRRAGSCGLPIGNEMRVVDDDDNEVPIGTLGEIVLRGENILKGYYKNEEATKRAFRGGWFHSGDIGYRDEDGYFYIVDRKTDMIIRGGENIYPREIDEVLYQHPEVASAAAVGVPDELYGEDVAAFIVLKEGSVVSAEEIVGFCRERLADYKCPKRVIFLDEIPKGPTGKLLKRELARIYGENSAEREKRG